MFLNFLHGHGETPYEEVGGLKFGAGHPGHISRAARTLHRGLQKPYLEQEDPRMLVGISDTMDLVVLGHIEDDGKILHPVPLYTPCLIGT